MTDEHRPSEELDRKLNAEEFAQIVAESGVGDDLAEAIRLLENAANDLWAQGRRDKWAGVYAAWKFACGSLRHVRMCCPQAGAPHALHQLLAADVDWRHPSQILGHSRPASREILELARSQRAETRGKDLRELEEVICKLEHATALEESETASPEPAAEA